MAKTLLESVNAVLQRVGQIHGDTAVLTSLTSTSFQRSIDIAVQVINEGIDELYSVTSRPLPKEQAESTITLVDGDRDYALATDLVQLRYPLRDKTNNQYLHEMDYNSMLDLDIEQDDTGLPHWAAISPITGELHLDRAPTSIEAGRVYTYQYDKELELVVTTDTVPFGNAVWRAMRPAWAWLWRRDMQRDFDEALFNMSVGRASRLLTQEQMRDHYSPR